MNEKWRYKYSVAVALTLIVFCFVSLRLSIKSLASEYSSYQPDKTWIQPASLNENFPHQIGDNNWSLNYSNIEELLWESDFTQSSHQDINSDTAELLKKISSFLPSNLSDEELQRLSFLVKHSLQNNRGPLVASLINQYYLYQNEYLSALAEINSSKGDKKLYLLKKVKEKNMHFQKKYFSENLASRLFNKRNRLFNYLIDRRIVQMDTQLTGAQKEKKLLELKNQYNTAFSDR